MATEDKVISFTGTLAVEGELSKLNMGELKKYLERAVCLDLDLEGEGLLSDDVQVTGIGIDWESLEQ
jgi:hypothetical protein|tara:strand:+ start:369 stop:569 length:201 start_codon:yes stop_codon:yes gene_type:complete